MIDVTSVKKYYLRCLVYWCNKTPTAADEKHDSIKTRASFVQVSPVISEQCFESWQPEQQTKDILVFKGYRSDHRLGYIYLSDP